MTSTRALPLALAITLGAVTLLAGCALLGKGKALSLRYFDLNGDSAYTPAPSPSHGRLRLGQVSAARHLDRRFVQRTSAHEIRYHEEWRFTDQPDAFLRRALSRDLFERAGLISVISGAAPTLEVELTAFEEQTHDGHKRAYAALSALLHDDRSQLWQRRFEASRNVGSGDPAEALADALGQALAEVCAKLTEQTIAALPPADES